MRGRSPGAASRPPAASSKAGRLPDDADRELLRRLAAIEATLEAASWPCPPVSRAPALMLPPDAPRPAVPGKARWRPGATNAGLAATFALGLLVAVIGFAVAPRLGSIMQAYGGPGPERARAEAPAASGPAAATTRPAAAAVASSGTVAPAAVPLATGAIGGPLIAAALPAPDWSKWPPIPPALRNESVAKALSERDVATFLRIARAIDGAEAGRDASAAARWFRIAAEAGHPDATLRYAAMLAQGDGVVADVPEAVRLYRAAAEAGQAEAAFRLATLHANGAAGATPPAEVFALFRQAAMQGSVAAQYNVGILHAVGRGVARSNQEAYVWLTAAALNGDAEAERVRASLAGGLPKASLPRLQARARALLEEIAATRR
jgi:TPR repeat protein